MARPIKWTLEKTKECKEEILNQISIEGKPISHILNTENFPDNKLFYQWLEDDLEFSKRYARACEVRADKIFNELIDICDSTADDIILDSEGKEVVNHNVINRDKLRIDTRKWILSKMNPKKYGDKLDLTSKDEKIETITTLKLPEFLDKK